MSSANLALKIKEHEDRLSRIERIVEANALAIEKLHQEMLAFKEEGERERRRLHEEMLAFKEEMRAFKDEMLEFKNEMKAFKDEMLEFKNEMKAFKDEMRAFKDEMLEFKNGVEAFKEGMGEFKDWCKGQIREMNKQWGNLANKKITLIFVSLYIDEKFVDLLTEAGIYAMAYREWEYMDILNFDELSRLEDPRS